MSYPSSTYTSHTSTTNAYPVAAIDNNDNNNNNSRSDQIQYKGKSDNQNARRQIDRMQRQHQKSITPTKSRSYGR